MGELCRREKTSPYSLGGDAHPGAGSQQEISVSCAKIWARRLYRQSKRQEETQTLRDITASPRGKSQRWNQGTGQGKSSPSSPLPPCPFCSRSETFLTLLVLEQLPQTSQKTPPSKEASKRCHVCLCWKFRLCFCSFSGIAPLPVRRGGNHSRMKNEPVCVAGCWRGLASLPGGDCLLQQPRRGQQGLLGGTFRQAEKSPRRVPVRSRMRSQRNRSV